MRPGLIVADFVAPYAFVGVQASIEFEPMRPSDTDRDGVIDSRDRCPGTPAGEVVNSRGCPPPKDSDRDGVPDPADRCPDTPQGISVDAQGCPILPKQLVLDGVLFEYGSTEILSESDDALRRARRILLDNPTVRVEISGHTDNTGDAAFNRTLSKDRAQAVADWLVAHGVDPAQLTTAGYGSDQPAASNSTEEGRKQNRRIEFHRLD